MKYGDASREFEKRVVSLLAPMIREFEQEHAVSISKINLNFINTTTIDDTHARFTLDSVDVNTIA